MNVSRVVEIQTQGRFDYDHWVMSFRIEYSQDCATFYNLLDINNDNIVRSFLFDL